MHVHRQVEIACRPEALWKCLVDPQMLKQWIPGLVEIVPEPGPTEGVGAASTMRLREGGKVAAYRDVVTRWEPGTAIATRLTGGALAPGMHMDATYVITARAGACVLDYDVTCELKGIVYRLMAPLVWAMARANAKKSLDNLSAIAARS
jgi:carbon monoxide dehydrogenase subunit G